MREKVTVPAVLARKGGPKLTMVTAYDTPSARIADRAEIDLILVGDSVANNVLGHPDTLMVDMEVMVHHTAAVSRAGPRALVVADMPWLSYHLSGEDTVRNAGRLVREGGAETVKLEGGRKRLPVIRSLLEAEIPVMGHLGLTPQSVHATGGYRVQAKSLEDARDLLTDARALDEAGVFSIVLEGIPDVLAQIVTKEVSVPTIGIGAGPHTDGQVLVWHDVLGLSEGRRPKFVRTYADLAGVAEAALRRFASDVASGSFPSEGETYHMGEEAGRALLAEEPRSEP